MRKTAGEVGGTLLTDVLHAMISRSTHQYDGKADQMIKASKSLRDQAGC